MKNECFYLIYKATVGRNLACLNFTRANCAFCTVKVLRKRRTKRIGRKSQGQNQNRDQDPETERVDEAGQSRVHAVDQDQDRGRSQDPIGERPDERRDVRTVRRVEAEVDRAVRVVHPAAEA